MTRSKKNKLIVATIFIMAAMLFGMVISGGTTMKAKALTATQVTEVTEINLNDAGFLWIKLSKNDYGTEGNQKPGGAENIIAKLKALNLTDKIFINDKSMKELSKDIVDPYLNLFGRNGCLVLFMGKLADGDIVKIESGCQFPSKAYIESADDTPDCYVTEKTFTFKKVGTIMENQTPPDNTYDIGPMLSFDFDSVSKRDDCTAYYLKISVSLEKSEYLMDHDMYLQDYILYNGKTIRYINENTDDSKYVYTTSPTGNNENTPGNVFTVPIRLYLESKADTSSIVLYVHHEYMKADPIKSVGLKAGFKLRPSPQNMFVVNEDAIITNYLLNGSIHSKDILEEKVINATISDGLSASVAGNGIAAIFIKDAENPSFNIGYKATDGHRMRNLQKFITINGKTVEEINLETDTSTWDWPLEDFPYGQGETYRKPVQLLGMNEKESNGSWLALRIHENLIKIFDDDLTIGLKSGVEIYDKDTKIMYKTTADVSAIGYYKPFILKLHIMDEVKEISLKNTQPIELTDCEKAHYTFDGWFEDSEFTTAKSKDVMPKADYELFAKYTPEIYDVTISGEGVETSVQKVTYNELATKPETDPTKEMTVDKVFTFDGWYNGDVKFDFNTPVTENLSLVAKFIEAPRTYTVTFSDGVTAQEVEYNGKVNKPADPTKEMTVDKAYILDGWYNGDTKFDFDNDVITGDIELVAKFTETVRKYKVTFSDGVTAQEVEYNGKITKPEDPVKEGYEFVCWMNGETEFDFGSAVTKDIVLTAKFNEVKKGCGGTIDGSIIAVMVALICTGTAIYIKRKHIND